ncbi:MAG TPA: alpha-L-fucosidase, partial [Tepidisphaeraceae bacterium]|nr:alpha-L-fucosidase [Tepidisphaeraceae bacterium]
FAPGAAVPDVERGQLGDIQPFFWQSDTSVGMKSWCHIEGETYKSPDLLIGDLCDIVSKNGTLLLNIGPRADGSIPDEQVAILEAIGAWLKTNGEAIYGTRPWRVFGEGPTVVPEGHFTDAKRVSYTSADIRFTTHGQNALYAICLAAPSGEVVIRSLGTTLRLAQRGIKQVEWLGTNESVLWKQDETGLRVACPTGPGGIDARVIKIRF